MYIKKSAAGYSFFPLLLAILLVCSCASLSTQSTPTLSFMQYAFKEGENQVQKKSDVEISMEILRLSDVYKYPQLFSFRVGNLPQRYSGNPVVQNEYKPGPLGKSWENPFTSPDGKMQLLFCSCKVNNNTEHILRMKDARIYLIIEGLDPLPAISSFDTLLEQADYFENITNRERASQTALFIFQKAPLPEGFFRAIVLYNMKNYKLINDLNAEILPKMHYEGILVFPVITSFSPQAKISFYDVTIKTDKAGNPLEKIQFDFNLQRQHVQMWYDRYEKAWKVGPPPEIK